jgi:hypothetical protein
LNYEVSGSINFEPVFIHSDSSIILPMQIRYMDTISNAEKLDKQLKSNVLVRVYPEGKNKQAHYLPLNFLDVGGEIVKSKYINTWEKELVGYHNTKQNEILISTPISNRIISYNYMANSHSIKNIENYIDGIY